MTPQIKSIPLLLFVLLPLIFGNTCNYMKQKTRTNIKVCSFNIRFDNPGDGFNRWENRRENVVAFLAIEKPDIIGFQEQTALRSTINTCRTISRLLP